MKIITQQLANKLQRDHELLSNYIANPLDYSKLKSIFNNIHQTTIYDITYNKKIKNGEIVGVKDHINKTGTNPLIGKQKELSIDFIDITRIYQNNKKNDVITTCCGKKLNTKYTYPSHYLCNITILARACNIQTISAFLINIL